MFKYLFILAMLAVVPTAAARAGADYTGLAEHIDRLRVQHGVAASALILVEGEKLLLEHYSGVSNWESGRAFAADDYIRVGSITKAFTGLALLRAEQQGFLDLQQMVKPLLPGVEFDNPFAGQHPLRIAHLLEHTSGWYDMSRAEFDHNDPTPVSLARAVQVEPKARVSNWPPGWHSSYSNIGPGLASLIVEQGNREPFDEYMRKQVFIPMGMHSASLRLTPEISKRLIRGYNTDGKTPIPYWHIIYRASGGMNVQVHDMARFLTMLINRGQLDGRQIFSAAQIKRLETPHTTLAAGAGLEFGYGLGNYHSLYKGRVLHAHGGDADGYLAHYAYSLESGRGYFLVINAFNHKPLRAMQQILNDALIADLPAPEDPPSSLADNGVLSRYAGTYRQATVRFPGPGWQDHTLTVERRGGWLVTRRDKGRWRPLIPVNEQLFRRPGEPQATAAFIPLPDGRMIMQGRMGNFIRAASNQAGIPAALTGAAGIQGAGKVD